MGGEYTVYPEYKDSGAEWLGHIPVKWKALPIAALLEERGETNNGYKTDNVLSVMKDIGVIPYAEKGAVGNKKSDDIERYKLVHKGDLVVNSMNVIIGSVGVSAYEGALSPVYIVLKPRDSKSLDNNFVGYVFRIKTFQVWLKRLGYGILEHRMRIPLDNLKREYLPFPDIKTQQKVVAFLDYKTAKIDCLIEKQQQLIKLLKEKRQAVISHAVTKGLDPKVKMKDSGVDWLGEIPSSWVVCSFRRVLKKIDQGWSPEANNCEPQDDEWGVTKLSSVKQGDFFPTECKTLLPITEPDLKIAVKEGDFLFTRANTPALVGDACIVSGIGERKIMLCDLIYRLTLNSKSDVGYFCYLMLSEIGRYQIERDARGSSMTMAKISQEHIKSWIVLIPPFDEQRAISSHIRYEISELRHIESKVLALIGKLKEKRTSLISAAVTGKIDVRNWNKDKHPAG